jgi:hypothetical protein
MTNVSIPTRPLDDDPATAPGTVEVPEARVDRRRGRRDRRRSRRSLVTAVFVCAAVPTALILSLWQNLTQPFWYNEQWRAYYISIGGNWWSALKGDGAPFPAGWYFLERISSSLFGSTELVLRLTTAAFVPLVCVLLMLLARRYMPIFAASVVGLVGGLTGTLFLYAVQLSEYEIDAAAVIAVVLLHEIASDAEPVGRWRSPTIYLAYAGIALACIFSTPAIFVAAPILLLDAYRGIRARAFGPQIIGACGAGLIALVHLEAFVVPQNALTKSNYWDANFMPHNGIGNQIAFTWDGLRGFVTGTFTGSDTPFLPELLNPRLSWILTAAFVGLLTAGIVVAARSRNGRALLAGIGGSLALTLIASYIRYWPFGFVRTNFYLVPLLILLAAIGAARMTAVVFERARNAKRQSARRRATMAGIAVSAVTVVALVMAVGYEAGTYRQVREVVGTNPYGIHIGSAVASVKTRTHPDSALVVAGLLAVPPWQYYQYEYTGWLSHTGHQIQPSHAAFVVTHGSSTITKLMTRVKPSQVFLYVAFGATATEVGQDLRAVELGESCHEVADANYPSTGLLITLSCSPG